MKSSEILRRARTMIEEKRYRFVCHAVEAAGGSRERKKTDRILERIRVAIHPHHTVRQWLVSRGVRMVNPRDWQDLEDREAMRQYRLNWIAWMIEGYEAVGD